MKSIIFIAFLCATFLSASSKPAEQKTDLVEIFKEKIFPKLAAFPAQKFTRANLHHLLEDGKPGLREIVDQFIDSVEEIYNVINRGADRLVPLFQQYNLNEAIQEELPEIVQRGTASAYQLTYALVSFVHHFSSLSDEDTVELFIELGLVASAVAAPSYTSEGLYNFIRSFSVEAGLEFKNILEGMVLDSLGQAEKFLKVLFEALDAIDVKH